MVREQSQQMALIKRQVQNLVVDENDGLRVMLGQLQQNMMAEFKKEMAEQRRKTDQMLSKHEEELKRYKYALDEQTKSFAKLKEQIVQQQEQINQQNQEMKEMRKERNEERIMRQWFERESKSLIFVDTKKFFDEKRQEILNDKWLSEEDKQQSLNQLKICRREAIERRAVKIGKVSAASGVVGGTATAATYAYCSGLTAGKVVGSFVLGGGVTGLAVLGGLALYVCLKD